LFVFSGLGEQVFLYGVLCTLLLGVGVLFLYRHNNPITASVCVSYILFYAFLSLGSVPLVRFLVPFAAFYYSAFVCGAVVSVKWVRRLLLGFRGGEQGCPFGGGLL
jgi:hypothetical protein